MNPRGAREIRSVNESEVRSVVDILCLAFSSDPFMRWLYPEASAYERWFPEFVCRYSGESFAQGTAMRTDAVDGAALWLEPDTRPAIGGTSDLLEASVNSEQREELWRISETLMETTPVQPYWQLTFIGVDPVHQGQGIGSALLEHGLARCDETDRVAYLETANPRTLPFFIRHGFQLIDVARTTDGPSIYAMAREPGGDQL